METARWSRLLDGGVASEELLVAPGMGGRGSCCDRPLCTLRPWWERDEEGEGEEGTLCLPPLSSDELSRLQT